MLRTLHRLRRYTIWGAALLLLAACGGGGDDIVEPSGADASREAPANVAGAPIYRFAKISSGAYFYTGSQWEADHIRSNLPDFRYEGIAFYQSDQGTGAPVYRFANTDNGGYFYTASVWERDNTIANYANMRYEGSTFSVAPAGDAAASPVFRLANLSNGAYLYTTNLAERDAAVSMGHWRDEGSTFSARTAGESSARRPAPVAAGVGFSLVIRSDGKVLHWGTGMTGATRRTGIGGTPASVLAGLDGVAALALGDFGQVAIDDAGRAFVWGSGSNGAFGDWWTSDVDMPLHLPQYGVSVQVASHRCSNQASVWFSLHEDGSVWTVPGIVDPGTGTQGSVVTAKRVEGLPPIASLGTGGCVTAISRDGVLFSLTTQMTSTYAPNFVYEFSVTPNPIAGIPPVVDASCGNTRCIVAGKDGTAWAWGSNQFGELGDGTTISRFVPIQIPALADIRRVLTTSNTISFALNSSGKLYSWGNIEGEDSLLGRGVDFSQPRIARPIDSLPLPVTSFSAEVGHAIAQLSDGSVWTWGYGGGGQLGDGTNQSHYRPVRVMEAGSTKVRP